MLQALARDIKWIMKEKANRDLVKGKTKFFCIGRNKTGTTTLKKAFEDLGYCVGSQGKAERLTEKFFLKKEFSSIVQYCESAEVFQDIPFSLPDMYKVLDVAFPDSKFILTIRDDSEQWYRSYTKFYAKKYGKGSIPTVTDLRSANYIRKGWPYEMIKLHGTSDEDIWNKEIMINHYSSYNQSVLNYFKNRPDDLLVLNVAKTDSYQRFIQFLQIKSSPYDSFPWENKT